MTIKVGPQIIIRGTIICMEHTFALTLSVQNAQKYISQKLYKTIGVKIAINRKKSQKHYLCNLLTAIWLILILIDFILADA